MDIISEYRILKSAAGYYIGQGYREADWDGMYWLPYDRYSGYYRTADDAKSGLMHMILDCDVSDDDEYIMVRAYFEDNISFWHLLEDYS